MTEQEIRDGAPSGATHYYAMNETDVLYIHATNIGGIYMWNNVYGCYEPANNSQYKLLCEKMKPL